MDFEEPESFTLFGLAVRCTNAEQREIVRRMRATAPFARWHALDSRMRTLHVYSDSAEGLQRLLQEAKQAAEELAKAEVELTEALCGVIDAVLGG